MYPRNTTFRLAPGAGKSRPRRRDVHSLPYLVMPIAPLSPAARSPARKRPPPHKAGDSR